MALFFKRIYDLRVDNDLLQRDIAKILNVNKNTYPHWEKGMYEIPIDIIDKLANFYNVSIDYITGLSDDKGNYGKKYDASLIYKRLKELRIKNNLTQKQMSEITGLGQMNYSRYERGLILIPFSKLYLIAKKFNVSLDYLLGKENRTKVLS